VAADRKYEVYIDYPWSEKDDITIEMPAGFTLENADSPAPIKDKQGVASHEVKMSVKGNTLVYKREFSFGNGGYIRFPVSTYSVIKQFFELFNKADVHQLTLRQATAGAVAEKP
jgi:hypothetical protein